MDGDRDSLTTLPLEQQRIRAQCRHPTGTFIPLSQSALAQSVPARFEQMVREYPGHLAIASETHAYTYAEVNARANRLAEAILNAAGPVPRPVAVLLGQGTQAIIAILGVLKAGQFYVPLDSWLPPARLAFMLADTQPAILVTNEANLALAQDLAHNNCQIIQVEQLETASSAENPALTISPDALAYITYTSGSTGHPKGVMQSHRNLLQLVFRYTQATNLCAADRVAHLKSCSVTAGVTAVFASLLNGASVFPFDLKVEGVGALPEWLIRKAISILQPGPTAFRHCAATLTGAETLSTLRLIYLAGEPIHRSDVELYKRICTDQCVLIIGFGTTEAPAAGRYWIDRDTQLSDDVVPAGYPAEGMEFLLLDEAGREIDQDAVGEIAIKSRFVSPGYWRNPGLTQERFVPAPTGGGQRLYLTGDVGIRKPDGCLVHMGRRDFQVKIRGYRIETSEVEAVLAEAKNVKEVAVAVSLDGDGRQRLVAYVVPREAPAPGVSALRSHLAARLPEHMIPSHFMMLDALPLTLHGKVDRRALPAPDRARPALQTPFMPPRSPIETQLTHVWSELLALERVGIHDAFLDLGGHSLLAAQLRARITDIFQVDLHVQTLWEASTVAEMAVVIAQHQAVRADPGPLARLLTEVEGLTGDQTTHTRSSDG